jgi:tRNA 2-thiouridine synthesizing protein E
MDDGVINPAPVSLTYSKHFTIISITHLKEFIMAIEIGGVRYETDENGYLVNLDDWSEEVAKILAEGEEIEMDEVHWDIVNFLRRYYAEYQIAPAVKVLTKAVAAEKGMDKKEASEFLYGLFPKGPGLQACKIAGLPKPTGCV